MSGTELVIFLTVIAVLVALGKYLEIRSYRRRAKMFEDEKPIGYTLTAIQKMRYDTATSRLERLQLPHIKERLQNNE